MVIAWLLSSPWRGGCVLLAIALAAALGLAYVRGLKLDAVEGQIEAAQAVNDAAVESVRKLAAELEAERAANAKYIEDAAKAEAKRRAEVARLDKALAATRKELAQAIAANEAWANEEVPAQIRKALE